MTKRAGHQVRVICHIACMWWLAPFCDAAGPPTFAGPAMGTTYRVTLARDVLGLTSGQVHREIEAVLARLDRALSTWRDDSDALLFNRAAAGEWVSVSPDLVTVVTIARRVHDDTHGAFDITAAAGTVAGMHLVEIREQPPALRKARDDVALDLSGIGPGYAVDVIGTRLVALGSSDHLVELGGEVRAWGSPPSGDRWRVAIRGTHDVWELAPGEAVATSSARPGRSPVDPRTGRIVTPRMPSVTVRAPSCAEADARAVAALVATDADPGNAPAFP